jgi:hypothetical protein
MRECTIHLDDAGHPLDLHYTDSPDRPVSAFLLLAHIPADPPGAVLLTFGNSNMVGNLLMTLYQRSVVEHPELAWTMEQVCRAIVTMADAERKDWPEDGKAGNA